MNEYQVSDEEQDNLLEIGRRYKELARKRLETVIIATFGLILTFVILISVLWYIWNLV
jgi:hypothetical protein